MAGPFRGRPNWEYPAYLDLPMIRKDPNLSIIKKDLNLDQAVMVQEPLYAQDP